MPLVGVGDGPLDELGNLNEQPDHSLRQARGYFGEALLLNPLNQAAPSAPGALHRAGTLLQGG